MVSHRQVFNDLSALAPGTINECAMDRYRRSWRTHICLRDTNSPIMDYGFARDIIEYRARNGSQINVAITTGRPRVLHRSIIHPTLDYADRSIACGGRLFARPRGGLLPRTNDSVAWQPFYFLAAFFPFVLSPSRRTRDLFPSSP